MSRESIVGLVAGGALVAVGIVLMLAVGFWIGWLFAMVGIFAFVVFLWGVWD